MSSWYFNNIDYAKSYQRKYRENNRHVFKAKSESYRARLLNAEPKWTTSVMRKKMVDIYKYCRLTSIYHGISHSVDHIVPLKGDNVCGLHVYWNLQIVPSSYNMKKKNKQDFNDNIPGYTVIDESLVDHLDCPNFERKVIRLNDGKVFNSVTLAAKEENTSPSTITQICKMQRNCVRRNFYKYYEEVDNVESAFNKAKESYLSNPKSQKAVYCEINDRRYENTKKASIELGLKDYKVRELCNSNKIYGNIKLKYCL